MLHEHVLKIGAGMMPLLLVVHLVHKRAILIALLGIWRVLKNRVAGTVLFQEVDHGQRVDRLWTDGLQTLLTDLHHVLDFEIVEAAGSLARVGSEDGERACAGRAGDRGILFIGKRIAGHQDGLQAFVAHPAQD